MTPQPTAEQKNLLNKVERFGYWCANFCNQKIKTPLIWWNYSFMNILIWFCLGRRLQIHGLEHLKSYDKNDSLIMVANHRSFFDFFIVTWITYNKTNLPKRIFFPVRSKFFYDSIVGIFSSFIMGGFAMFPPIFREPHKRPFNRYAIDRIVSELQTKKCLVGFHPEGTRNKDTDPYKFLPAKPGVGEVIINSPNTKTLPIFIHGVTSNFITEFKRNWFYSSQFPIHVWLKEPVTFNPEPDTRENQLILSQKCMEQISFLADRHRQYAKGKE